RQAAVRGIDGRPCRARAGSARDSRARCGGSEPRAGKLVADDSGGERRHVRGYEVQGREPDGTRVGSVHGNQAHRRAAARASIHLHNARSRGAGSRSLTMVWHIFKKDLRLLWVFALTVGALQFASAAVRLWLDVAPTPQLGAVAPVLTVLTFLGMVVLTVA